MQGFDIFFFFLQFMCFKINFLFIKKTCQIKLKHKNSIENASYYMARLKIRYLKTINIVENTVIGHLNTIT